MIVTIETNFAMYNVHVIDLITPIKLHFVSFYITLILLFIFSVRLILFREDKTLVQKSLNNER